MPIIRNGPSKFDDHLGTVGLSDEPASKSLLTAADIATRTETRIRHPLNPNSEVY
jgi:hypothetical protein